MDQKSRDLITHNATKLLCATFDVTCKEERVYQGLGPAMAYFRRYNHPNFMQPDEYVTFKTYEYVAFGMAGVKESGQDNVGHADVDVVLQKSAKVFRDWLQPNKTLVWRAKPEIGWVNGQYVSYWRCVQLDDDATRMIVEWDL